MSLVQVLLAIFLPPVSVFLQRGVGIQLLLNVILTFAGFGIGGMIHAIWLLTTDNA